MLLPWPARAMLIAGHCTGSEPLSPLVGVEPCFTKARLEPRVFA
jgi:hypothetical protein